MERLERRLSRVIGQTGVSRLIARLIDRKRLPHGLLLEGIPGCGRRTLALAAASALLCHDRRDGDACGSCRSCILAAEDNHPDLVCLPHDTESDALPVDLVRERIVQQAFESPLLGSTRVFVLPGVERLEKEAANTLLKVLEEPPPGAYLIMTTAHARAVIGTIRSRVQLYRLQALTSADLELVLRRLGLSEPDAHARAAQGLGSHRGLAGADEFPAPLEQLLDLCRGEFRAALVADIVAALPQKQPAEDDGSGRTLAREQRRVCGQWLHALLQSLRSHLTGPQATAHADLIERVLLLERDLQRNINPRLIIEALSGF